VSLPVLAPLDEADILEPEDHDRRPGQLGRSPLRVVDELQLQHRWPALVLSLFRGSTEISEK